VRWSSLTGLEPGAMTSDQMRTLASVRCVAVVQPQEQVGRERTTLTTEDKRTDQQLGLLRMQLTPSRRRLHRDSISSSCRNARAPASMIYSASTRQLYDRCSSRPYASPAWHSSLTTGQSKALETDDTAKGDDDNICAQRLWDVTDAGWSGHARDTAYSAHWAVLLAQCFAWRVLFVLSAAGQTRLFSDRRTAPRQDIRTVAS